MVSVSPVAVGLAAEAAVARRHGVCTMTPSNGEGVFTCATSYKYGDGLIPGKHKVALQYATDANGKLLIPKEYASLATTPLIVDTGEGAIDVRVPRP